MGKHLEVDKQKCVGCKACEVACAYKHHGVYSNSKARVKVYSQEEALFAPVFCSQCVKPLCLESCKFKAITAEELDGNWIVRIDKANCVGCKKCIKACPIGAITYLKEEKCVQKCDLCGGDPECVKFCIRKAVQFLEVNKNLDISKEVE